MGGPMRCGATAVPDGAMEAGRIHDPAAVARELRPLLARNEITQTRAMVAAADTLGTFRILNVPTAATPKDIDATIARELQFDPQRTATRWLDLGQISGGRKVYAVAWDRALLKNVVEAVRQASLEPVVVELKSASVTRLVPTATCIVVDLSRQLAELILVDGHLPHVWHSFVAPEPLTDDAAAAVARPIRSMLRFYRRSSDGEWGRLAPVFVAAEQDLKQKVLTGIADMVGQPVRVLPPPPRVPPEIRHTTYLGCLGLLMRRRVG